MMKNTIRHGRPLILFSLLLLLSNYNAFAQKTTIWIVCHAEKLKHVDMLSDTGKERAEDLMKALRHSGVETIYTNSSKASQQTANPLAMKVKILPRIYTDSLKKFVEILKRNFEGKSVLVITDYNQIIPMLSLLGADSPFDSLSPNDYDQLFTVTIKPSGDVESFVRYYGKKHHDNDIPQSYIMDSITPGVPGR
jgi:2,3-bisphosphoglycerate-dependent phosphoglycerate mutase